MARLPLIVVGLVDYWLDNGLLTSTVASWLGNSWFGIDWLTLTMDGLAMNGNGWQTLAGWHWLYLMAVLELASNGFIAVMAWQWKWWLANEYVLVTMALAGEWLTILENGLSMWLSWHWLWLAWLITNFSMDDWKERKKFNKSKLLAGVNQWYLTPHDQNWKFSLIEFLRKNISFPPLQYFFSKQVAPLFMS